MATGGRWAGGSKTYNTFYDTSHTTLLKQIGAASHTSQIKGGLERGLIPLPIVSSPSLKWTQVSFGISSSSLKFNCLKVFDKYKRGLDSYQV